MGNFLKNLHPLLRRKKNEYDNKDPNYAIIDMFSEELNSIERDALDSRIQSSLNTATGKYLDIYGDWYGLYRKDDEKDETYRDRIIEYVLLKRGTNNSIIDAIRRFLDDEEIYVNVYEPFQNIFYTNKSHLNGEDHLMGDYYRFAIIDITIGKRFPLEIIEEINKFKPAGVKVFFTYDSSYETSEDKIITNVFPKRYPKVTTYQNVDIFRGYGRLLYGHLNLGMAKVNEISDVFKTNNSLINSLDVLSGSATVGREYYNFTYKTKDSYIPKPDDFVTSISVENRNVEGEELNKDFYTDTNTRNNLSPETTIKPSEGRTSIYFNFDINEYMKRNGLNIVTLDVGNKTLREYVSNYFGEVTLDFDMKAMVSPTNKVNVSLSIYDFVSKVWVKISSENLDLNSKNVGNKLGSLLDYINNNLALFLRLNIEPVEQETNIQISYIDLFFNRYDKDIYTIKPFKGIIESYQETDYLAETDAIKNMSLENGDIITKSGYQPMQYLKLTDGYDNNIGRNLLLDSINRTKFSPNNIGKGTVTQNNDGSWGIKSDEEEVISVYRFIKHSTIGNITEQAIENGKWYTFSLDITTSEDTEIVIGSSVTEAYRPDKNNITSTTYNNKAKEKQRINHTFKIVEDIESVPIILRTQGDNSTTVDIVYHKTKLEEGIKGTPWQPNPEDIYGANDPNQYIDIIAKDVEGDIKPSKTVLRQENKPGINLLSNKDIIKNTSKGSYVQGDTKELTMSLWGSKLTDGYDNNIGRNLLLDSINRTKFSPNNIGKGTVTQNNDGSWGIKSDEEEVISVYRFIKHSTIGNITEQAIENGKWYTFSLDITTSEDTEIVIGSSVTEAYRPDKNNITSTTYNNKAKEKQRINHTFKIVEDIESVPIILRTQGDNSTTVDIVYHKTKLEEGIKGTPWQPNPEDIYGANDPNQYIDIIAKDVEGDIKPSKTVWGSKLTQYGTMEEKLEEGKTYTISYDMEILEIPDVPA